ncbi:MAG: LppP/LprE family lipoprotein [Solirubrobacteraceae bacterium]
MAKSPRPSRRLFALLALLTAAVLAGCGSGTKTVSVSSSPPETNTTTSSTTSAPTTSSTSTSSTSTTQAPETSQTTTEQATSSRTSSAPAFVEREEEVRKGPLAAAVATVEHAGFVPDDTKQYNAGQTLRVLLATKSGADGHASRAYSEQAFFFVDGRYLGTDASKPSAAIKLVSQSETEVVLSYELFDAAGAPNGEAEVHFQLDNGKLEALDRIPPAQPGAGGAGRL